MAKKDIAIVGYGETPVVLRGGRSSYDLATEVLEQMLNQTGIDKSEIDGIAVSETMSETSNPFWAVFLAEHLGLQTSWTRVLARSRCSDTSLRSDSSSAWRASNSMARLAWLER